MPTLCIHIADLPVIDFCTAFRRSLRMLPVLSTVNERKGRTCAVEPGPKSGTGRRSQPVAGLSRFQYLSPYQTTDYMYPIWNHGMKRKRQLIFHTVIGGGLATVTQPFHSDPISQLVICFKIRSSLLVRDGCREYAGSLISLISPPIVQDEVRVRLIST